MRDQNKLVAAQLPPAEHDLTSANCLTRQPGVDQKQGGVALFMEDWPAPPRCEDDDQMDDLMKMEMHKWRLQTLLAVQPFGVPSLALAQAYEKMFKVPFNLRNFGCDNLIPDLANKMADIMIVQEPDETTPILFPDYPSDKIFHDARLGHDFSRPNLEGDDSGNQGPLGDWNDIILRAWLDKDLDFPRDAVLPGESYEELCKISLAVVPGTRGLYRASLVSSGDPTALFIRLKTSLEVSERIRGLSSEIAAYFERTELPIDAYNVPDHFITLNFPCLVYKAVEKYWNRGLIVGRSKSDRNIIYVESVDFGGVYDVNKIFLYLMPREFLSVPRTLFEVSLAGIKPARDEGWSISANARLRCWSMQDYYLDIILMDPEAQVKDVSVSSVPSSSLNSSSNATGTSESTKTDLGAVRVRQTRRKRFHKRSFYEALVFDRNDDDMDICLNDILVLETYAIEDPNQVEKLQQIKGHLTKIFERIKGPKNPLGPIF